MRHNTLEYHLFFYKIFENRAANGENIQSIQSLGHSIQPLSPPDAPPGARSSFLLSAPPSAPSSFPPGALPGLPSLTLADCGLSDMLSESEGTCTRRENRKKRKAELEALNQQNNEE